MQCPVMFTVLRMPLMFTVASLHSTVLFSSMPEMVTTWPGVPVITFGSVPGAAFGAPGAAGKLGMLGMSIDGIEGRSMEPPPLDTLDPPPLLVV